jgi:hypothetical protein
MHNYDLKKPKSFNGFLTKSLLKHKIFASTIVNQGRTYLAITIDSVGYVESYRNLFILLGIKMTTTTEEDH